MRGLPPDPANTVRLITTVDVDGSDFSFELGLLAPLVDAASPAELELWLGNWILIVGPALGDLMHAGAHLLTCRLVSKRMGGPSWTATFPPNHGNWSGGQADQVALGIYVKSTAYGRGAGSRVRIPAIADVMIDANRAVSVVGQGKLLALCNAIADFLNQPLPWGGGLAIAGTIQRQRAGSPLSAATFAPAQAIVPSRRVETIRRRLPGRGQISPS